MGPSDVVLSKGPNFLALGGEDVELGISFAASKRCLYQFLLLKKYPDGGKIGFKIQVCARQVIINSRILKCDEISVSLDNSRTQLLLSKNETLVSTFTAKIHHLSDPYDDANCYYPVMAFDAATSYLTMDVTRITHILCLCIIIF